MERERDSPTDREFSYSGDQSPLLQEAHNPPTENGHEMRARSQRKVERDREEGLKGGRSELRGEKKFDVRKEISRGNFE